MKKLIGLCLFFILVNESFAHDIDYSKQIIKHWSLAEGNISIDGSFSMYKNGEVYIEDMQNSLHHFPLSYFKKADQDFVLQKYQHIMQLNDQLSVNTKAHRSITQHLTAKGLGFICLIVLLGVYTFFIAVKEKRKYLSPIFLVGLVTMLYGFSDKKIQSHLLTTTDPAFVDSAFAPFKPKVYTHWDDTYFYVESKGIPDHEMMVGITAWQQQLPIPQCYTTANNNNAWSIPLNPVIASTPVPVNQQHFLRGAIAVAVNGVAIFNPYTNTGVDAFLDGQLDNFGGHCGRADDYHYHIAPLHLYGQTVATLPIAFALDGFAVYGSIEPDGTAMKPLDANHGHFGSNGVYHYHGSAAAPYMIGNMVGQVTEDNTLQIIPQAAARPVRPSLTPLTGAVIVACQSNANNNGYNVTYTKDGQNYQVNYNWADSTASTSKYTFHFISPTSSVDAVYEGFSQSQCSVPTGTVSKSVKKTMLRLPDTGENTGYTTTAGEDADYLINTPYFVDNLDGTITDTITGLMWQKKDGGEMTFENAGVYVDSLTVGGYTDWRLPDAHESFSILNQQYANPAIDTNFFTKTLADYWWTSSKQQNDSTKIWSTNAGGGIGNKPKNETISAGGTFRYHTRAVRETHPPVILNSHFSNNNNGTIKDNFTNYIWQKIPYTDTLTWENALIYADTLTLAGYSDWRLPNIKELQSINNESLINPSIDTNYFRVLVNKKYWSSTTLSNHTNQSWYLNTRFGITSYDLKTVRNYVICLRGNSSVLTNYVFTGNGNWDIPSNWLFNEMPPPILPSGSSILIDPIINGECLLNVAQHISKGATITVNTGKKFKVPGELLIKE